MFAQDCAGWNTNAAQQRAEQRTGRRKKNPLKKLKKQIAGDELSQQVTHRNSEHSRITEQHVQQRWLLQENKLQVPTAHKDRATSSCQQI